MAFAYTRSTVHENGAGASATCAVTLASTVAVGSLVEVSLGWAGNSGDAAATVADDKGNTYTAIDRAFNTGSGYWWSTFYRDGVANAPITITATMGGGNTRTFISIVASEWTGSLGGSSLSGHAINTQTNPGTSVNAVTSTNFTPGVNNCLVVGALVNIGTTSGISAGTGYTFRLNNSGNWNVEDKTLVVAAAGAATFTTATSNASLGFTTSGFGIKPAPISVVAGAGSYNVTGTAATPKVARTLAAGLGSYSLTGATVATKVARTLAAGSGAYSLTGSTATLRRNLPLAAGSGAYSLTGSTATLRRNLSLAADVGTYALTGAAASLLHKWILGALGDTYALSGSAATLKSDRKITVSAASYILTGTDVLLISGENKALAAGVGSYSLTGTGVSPLYRRVLAAEAGSYSLTGTAASPVHRRAVTANGGAYVLTGTPASLRASNSNIPRGFLGGWGPSPHHRQDGYATGFIFEIDVHFIPGIAKGEQNLTEDELFLLIEAA